MRQVATIADEAAAKRLADHLLAMDITNRLDRTDKGWVLWVHREDRMDRARKEVEDFLADPNHPRFAGAAKAAELVRKEAIRKEREHAKNSINLRGRLNVPSFERCPVTHVLIGLSVAMAIITNLGHNLRANQPFLLSPIIATAQQSVSVDQDAEPSDAPRVASRQVEVLKATGLDAVLHGQFWRLITPIFLHFSVFHIAFNLMMLYRLGCLIEMRKGKLVMIGLVLATAAFSNLAQYFWNIQVHGPAYIGQVGGMSGVIYGLFGYVWMKADYEPEADIKISTDLLVQMILWLLLCMAEILPFHVANAAHVAGLVVGILIGVAPHLWQTWR